ncbi:MAG: hypothetical protein IH961_09310 [Chloroflexi bacterium]|nr:hypothetical protein [Chloroflexota bacterium]
MERDTMRLVKNAVEINKLQQRKTRIAVYRSKPLADALVAEGFLVKEFDRAGWTGDLKFYDAVATSSEILGNGQDLRNLVNYVRGGGVFVGAVTGWGWQQVNTRRNPNLDLAVNMHHNAVLRTMGLMYGRAYVGGFRPIKATEIPLTNCQYALQRLIAQNNRKEKLSENQLRQWSSVLINAVQNVNPFDNIVRGRLDALIRYVGGSIVPTDKAPLKADEPLKRLALYLDFYDTQKIRQDEIVADNAARVFPGLAPRRAKRTKRDVLIRGTVPGWVSTGLWINAGERVTVTVPEHMKDKGLRIRIGSHSDQLWQHREWKRHPSITREFPITEAETKARSEFGGLVYIVLPNGANFSDFQVNIAGAVRVPRFVLGETSLTHWLETERDLPAPWAELQSDRIILTVPAEVVRKLDDPDQLMEHWDRVLATYAELSMRPLAKRPQRMVCDVQISVGYMHSGYPIMMHLDQPENLVSIHKQEKGTRDNWGFWHELGHNHQQPDWTFFGSGEVTCNLFSIFVLEKIYGTELMVAADYDREKLDKYLADGANFATWRREPFLALMMYVQLIDRFGWEPFHRVFAEYRDLSAAERPKNDQQKRDQWLVRFSRAVRHDLGPFFEKWGVPTSAAARASVANLPAWMHMDLAQHQLPLIRPGLSAPP